LRRKTLHSRTRGQHGLCKNDRFALAITSIESMIWSTSGEFLKGGKADKTLPKV